MTISDLFSLLSGVALFLFGMTLMGDGLKKVAGNRLEVVLYHLSSSPLRGVFLGTGVTAVIQSSSATSVMVVGFVNSGMMKVRQAISIVLGAILGTSITGWIICLSSLEGGGGTWIALLSTSTLTSVIAIAGIILRMFCKTPVRQRVGDILLGFAVLMLGMSMMSGAVAGLRESESFLHVLTSFSNPLLGILVGTLFTCVLQSASAAVGILQALAFTGALRFSAALPLIMGIAIGAAVPVLLSALGANINGRRTAFVYLLIDTLGVVIWGCIFYAVNAAAELAVMDRLMTPVSVALVNTLFRLATVLVLTPFIGLLDRIVCLLFPDAPDDGLHRELEPLEERFVTHPALALEQSGAAVDGMAERTMLNLSLAMGLLEHYTDDDFAKVTALEDLVDRCEDRLGTYLMKITGQDMTDSQSETLSKYLHTISDFERISDHAMNIAEAAQEIHQKSIVFSDDACRELDVIGRAVTEIAQLSMNAFIRGDLEQATRVEPLEELIDNLCDEIKLHHVDRLQRGVATLNQGFVFNDLLTNYERVADHCSNLAVAMIELESADFNTHEYLNSLKAMKSESFARYFTEYSRRFSL